MRIDKASADNDPADNNPADNDPADNDPAGDDPVGELDDELGDEPEISLEDLGAAYAAASDQLDGEFSSATRDEEDPPPMHDGMAAGPSGAGSAETKDSAIDATDPAGRGSDLSIPAPEAIVEGALFVGHPTNEPLTATRIASLMRDVSATEVIAMIDSLNDSYRQNDQALRIVQDEGGYRMTVSPNTASVRSAFLGKVRETRLNQPAIDVLALVAYQPGISAAEVTDQRGRDCGAILNQLVRRQLLMIERVKPDGGGRAVVHYYPTERFLHLFELESLQDLPQVQETMP